MAKSELEFHGSLFLGTAMVRDRKSGTEWVAWLTDNSELIYTSPTGATLTSKALKLVQHEEHVIIRTARAVSWDCMETVRHEWPKREKKP